MSILKRVSKAGKVSYFVRVFSSYDQSGKRIEVCETWPRRKDAEEREAELKKQLKLGTWQKPTKLSLSDFFAEWLEKSASIRLKPQTVELYGNLFRIYIKPHLGNLQLLQLLGSADAPPDEEQARRTRAAIDVFLGAYARKPATENNNG